MTLARSSPSRASRIAVGSALVAVLLAPSGAHASDALASWNAGPAKSAITAFVDKVITKGGPGYVPESERIAVFDNDGTLWAEQPMYVELAFALDRVKAMAPQHPDWATKEPFASAIKGDVKKALAGGDKATLQLVAATHFGMTVEEFSAAVSAWITSAKHPATGRLYTEMVYQPMLELLAYLRANGFKTYIVSGGGVEFMRPWAERVYGIPPEQVVGSYGKLVYQVKDGRPVIVKSAEMALVDDKEGKPVGIQTFIGRRPIAAFGNSDGDRQMLEWTTSGPGSRLGLIVHHTDAEREWAYDRASPVGKLDKALDQAKTAGWTVVDMKADWKTIYPPQR